MELPPPVVLPRAEEVATKVADGVFATWLCHFFAKSHTIAIRLEAIASRLEAIALRLEAIVLVSFIYHPNKSSSRVHNRKAQRAFAIICMLRI